MPHVVVDRPNYLQRLHRWRENGLVKVLTGPRHAGKSFLLQCFRESLCREGVDPSRLVTLDLEAPDSAAVRNSAREDFRRFLATGGFPEAAAYREDEAVVDLVARHALSDSLLKDVLPRRRLRSVPLLGKILRALASSVGKPLSLASLQASLSAAEPSLSPVTLSAYVEALAAGGIFFKAARFDVRERRVLQGGETLFLSDLGFRRAVETTEAPAPEALLKNVVYLELRRRYPKVWTGKAGTADFIVEQRQELRYFQVAETVLDPVALERKLQPLKVAKDAFLRCLLTMDDFGSGRSLEGVRQLDACEWLLDVPSDGAFRMGKAERTAD